MAELLLGLLEENTRTLNEIRLGVTGREFLNKIEKSNASQQNIAEGCKRTSKNNLNQYWKKCRKYSAVQ